MALQTIIRMGTEWAAVGTSPAARQALERLCAAEPAVAALGARDLAEVVAAVSSRSRSLEPATAARVIAALLRSAGAHPLVPRAILQAMLPGVVATATAVGACGPWEDLDAVVTDAVRMTWEIVTKWSGQYRPWAVRDVTNALRHRLRRDLLAWRRECHGGADACDRIAVYPGEEQTALDRLAAVIADRVGSGLARPDAVAVYGRRVLGFTRSEMAARTGQTVRQVEYRTDRGERCLTA